MTEERNFRSDKNSNFLLIAVIVLALVFAASQMFYLALGESATTDEKVHLASGYSYYKFGNFYLNPEHPPLSKLAVGLPVYLMNPRYPETEELFEAASQFHYDSWRETRVWAEDFLYRSGNEAQELLVAGRTVNIILTLFLILFLTYWGYQIGRWPGAALAATLSSFQPIILAHGHLANTDILIALLFTLLVYSWWRYLQKGSWGWFFAATLFFALSAVSKFTFLLFVPFILISLFICWLKYKKPVNFCHLSLKVFSFVIVTLFIIWAAYGFSLDFLRAPAILSLYFKGLFMMTGHALGGHLSYLFGEFSRAGWWYYFPAAILLKTPLGFLGLLVFSFATFKKLLKKDWLLQMVLLTGIFSYLILAMMAKANLGQRHIMLIYPLLVIFAILALLHLKKKWQKITVGFLLAATIFSTVLNFKNQIAYFNLFSGGAKNGYKYLLDSNYDWGQSLIDISKYLKMHNFDKVYLSYWWASPGEAEYYGIRAQNIAEFDRKSDAVIIVDPMSYLSSGSEWMREAEIIDRISNTIFVLQYGTP